jgi:hypothetical protein
VATAVKNAKAGQVQFRVDKAGIIHATIGRASFEGAALRSNLAALIEALQKAKPATSKGVYLRKIALSSTQGVGVRVDQSSLAAEALKNSVAPQGAASGLWAVAGSSKHATGYQRPLVGVQQAGNPLIQANADGEPEKVLQW